ncbi:MAG TPA: alpha/beta hydrolase [Bryobacteraceae bacterium]|jgi:esterase|nr:alpha/beta hydrolase [Bryobacteraceae bacterium]
MLRLSLPDTLSGMKQACCVVALQFLSVTASLAQAGEYQDRFVTLNGLRIHYLDWGGERKPPLIMLHGIGRVAHSFDHIAPRFRSAYHVIAMDLRGHGDSDWSPDGAYLVEDYVKDLDAFVTKLDLHAVVLLGNSTGGRVVQVYAGMHPERVARLVVEDVGPQRTNEIASGFARRVEQEDKGWASEDELVASLMRGGSRVSEELQRNYAHFGSRRRADGRIVWKRDPNLVKGFVPTDLWRFVSKIQCPTIYILGGASNIVPPETQKQLKETLPDCQIVIMPGLGHYPHQEAPAEYIRLVQQFLG